MKVGLPQLSIGDRVEAAKGDTRPSNTDTSAVPSDINPSPGDSSISNIDTGALDSAGATINGQSQQGNKATSDSARKTQSQEASGIQYPKETVNATDQAPTAPSEKELAQTPQPKSKGFMESLIDSQMSSMLSSKTGGDHPAQDTDYGHNNGDPNEHIGDQPQAQPIRRDRMDPYNNQKDRVPEPNAYPIKSFDRENTMEPYKAPKTDLGPQYKQKTINQPTVKFNSPKINLPRFN